MRTYQVGDSEIRYILTMPRDAAFGWQGRILCRLFHLHGATCRGRRDHWPKDSVPGRWPRQIGRRWKF